MDVEKDVGAQPRIPVNAEKRGRHSSFYMSVLMLSGIALIVVWDVTALSLALPVIADQLHGTTFQSFWANTAFIFGVAVVQPINGSVSDVLGRKYPLYASCVLFGIGCVVFATASNMNVVVAGRLIQGFGAGGLDILQTIILCDITTLKERPRWLGVLSAANAVAAVTGPFLGAGLAQPDVWPWLGWIGLILAGITALLAYFFLHLKPLDADLKDRVRMLDWYGFILFAIMAAAISLPLSWADTLYPWGSWQTLLPLVIGIALIVPFAYIEKNATAPMIPYQILDNFSINAGMVSGLIYGLLLNPILLYIPLFYQAVYRETPLGAAESSLPLCVLIVAMSIGVSLLMDWHRKYRIALWTGWCLTAIFLGLNYIVGGSTSKAQAYGFQAVLGAGLGTVLVATQITVLASTKQSDDEGLAAGLFVTVRFIGSLLGFAVCSTVFTSMFRRGLSSLQALPQQLVALEDASQAVSFIPQLREIDVSPDVLRAVTGAYEDAFKTIWIVLAAFASLATLVCLRVRESSLEREDVGRQGFEAPQLETFTK